MDMTSMCLFVGIIYLLFSVEHFKSKTSKRLVKVEKAQADAEIKLDNTNKRIDYIVVDMNNTKTETE